MLIPGEDTEPLLYWETVARGAKSKVLFRCLNTAWVSRNPERGGQLFFPVQVVRPVEVESDLVVTLLHHPYGWLEPNNARALRRTIETSSDLILTGHEHESDSYQKALADGATAAYVEGAALQDPKIRVTGFNLVMVDQAASTYQVTPCVWEGGYYAARPSVSRMFVRSQNLLEHHFQNNEVFRRELDDVGTPFTHKEKADLRLSDLFVYPDLRLLEGGSGSRTEKLIRSGKVLQYVAESTRLKISGGPKSGKTSLAKMLYRDLLEQKRIVPVLMSGEDFKGTSYEAVTGAVARVFKRQYSDRLYGRFSQLAESDRVFIVDDWHRFTLNGAARDLVIKALAAFGGRIVLLADEATMVQEVAQLGEGDVSARFGFCEIKQLGFELRTRLVSNWMSLGREFQIEELELTSEISSAEHLLDTLISSGIVPAYPFFVISVLQARDTSSGGTNYGSFGHIYEQLLTARLAVYGHKFVGAKLTFLSRIAYRMHRSGRLSVSGQEYAAAVDRYSTEYAVSEDSRRWRDEFLESRILQEDSGEIRFIYRYAYYFLLAWYFNDGISNAEEAEELRGELADIVDAIHEEERTNPLVFYLYLSKDRQIIERLISKAKDIFAGVPEFNVAADLGFANSLCRRHPKLIAPSSDHRGNRLADRRRKDEAGEGAQEKEDEEERKRVRDKAGIESFAGYQLLNVMGQVVRNCPLELRADQKRALVLESCGIGLRVIKDFLRNIEVEYPQMSSMLREILRQHPSLIEEEEDEIAYASNMFLVGLVESVLIGVIKRVSFCIGIRELEETYLQIRGAVGDDNLSMRILDLEITLEHFARIPVADVEELARELEPNVLGYTMLRVLVGEFLSMFPCPYRLRQKMESLLHFAPNDPKMRAGRKVRKLLGPAT